MKKNPTKRQKFVRKAAPIVVSSVLTAAAMFVYFHRTIELDVTEDTVDKMRDGLSARYDTPRNGRIYVHMNEHRK